MVQYAWRCRHGSVLFHLTQFAFLFTWNRFMVYLNIIPKKISESTEALISTWYVQCILFLTPV